MSQLAPRLGPLPCTPGNAVCKWGVCKYRKVRSSFSSDTPLPSRQMCVLQMELRNLGRKVPAGPCLDPGAADPCHPPTVSSLWEVTGASLVGKKVSLLCWEKVARKSSLTGSSISSCPRDAALLPSGDRPCPGRSRTAGAASRECCLHLTSGYELLLPSSGFAVGLSAGSSQLS